MKLQQSPVDKIIFRGHPFFIKRDDLLHPSFSGNKARKFYYFLKKDFPRVTKLIGHGSPQANSLYSLSVLAKLKGWELDFYVDHIASWLKQNPAGNYKAALENKANVLVVPNESPDNSVIEFIEQQILPNERNAIFVSEGGRCEYAELGVKKLADEIIGWAEENLIDNLKVVLPSGTGTTALFLQKNIPYEVLTCACVGGESYLEKQFQALSPDKLHYPTTLPTEKKYHFGKLYKEFYQIWKELKIETGIEFELLYDPLGWITTINYIETLSENGDETMPSFLYIHQGGLLGNETMLPRYRRKLA